MIKEALQKCEDHFFGTYLSWVDPNGGAGFSTAVEIATAWLQIARGFMSDQAAGSLLQKGGSMENRGAILKIVYGLFRLRGCRRKCGTQLRRSVDIA